MGNPSFLQETKQHGAGHCVPLRVRESLLLQPGVQGALRPDPAGTPEKLKRAVMADIHCFEQDDPAGDSTAYMFDR